ncbi:hypothetical protein AAF712_013710 [Marasmius tenuissimus]|uniref:Uncharacterized protein n=1 Tax=Marasmius tenuissimus TaxID=585030 RepID=A0ABR2ZF06_9AGAR
MAGSQKTRKCPICCKDKNVHGIETHIKKCTRDAEDRQKEEEFERRRILRKAVTENTARASLQNVQPIPVQAHEIIVEFPEREPYQEAPSSPDNNALIEPLAALGPESWNEDRSHRYVEGANESVMPWTGPDIPNTNFKPLKPNTILIEHHPASMNPTRVMEFDSWKKMHSGHQQSSTTTDPWKPFSSRFDFEVAEFALKANLNRELTNRLLSLLHCAGRGIPYAQTSFTSYESICKAWERAGNVVTPFEKVDLSMKVKISREVKDYNISVHCRSLLGWTKDILRDPSLSNHLHWDAQRLYRWNGSKWVRFVTDPWTADRFWEIQSSLPPGGKPLCYIIYSDKSKLSSFGTAKGYPVVARIANIDTHIRNSNVHFGGGRVVGWLDTIPDEKRFKKNATFINFKRIVYHRQVEEVIKTIQGPSFTGLAYEFMGSSNVSPTAYVHQLFPSIPISSADYEEQAMITHTKGSNSLKPCPVCLVPKEELADHTCVHPLRTATDTKRVIHDKDLSHETGVRQLENAYWGVNNSDPHSATSYDLLHAGTGLFDHMRDEVEKRLESQGPKASGIVDDLMSQIPRWRNLTHFDQVTDVHFTDGTKKEHMAKQLPFCLHTVLTKEGDPAGYVLVRCLHAFRRFRMYASLTLHTSDTISKGRSAALKLSQLIQEYARLTADEDEPKSWNFPKAHTYIHVFDDIMNKGVTRNYNTKINENMHGPLKDAYQLRTNFKNFAPQVVRRVLVLRLLINASQILRVDHYSYAATVIRQHLNKITEELTRRELARSLKEQGEANIDTVAREEVHMSVPGPRWTFKSLEEHHQHDPAYSRFRIRFQKFLLDFFPSFNLPLPPATSLQLKENDEMVWEHRLLKCFYSSVVNWDLVDDYLRSNPSFHGGERYDVALIDHADGFFFARLVLLFKCKVECVEYLFALVQPLNARRGYTQVMEKEMGLYRVRAQARMNTQFIPASSIIRGAVAIKNYGADFGDGEEYYIMDDLDEDLFLRMESFKYNPV